VADAEIEVKHHVPEPPWNGALFYTEFDSKRISDDQKIEEIKKRLGIIDVAYKELREYERRHAEELPSRHKTK